MTLFIIALVVLIVAAYFTRREWMTALNAHNFGRPFWKTFGSELAAKVRNFNPFR